GNCDAHSGAVGAGVRPGAAVLNLGTSACYMAVMPLEEMKGHFIEGLFGQAEGTILEGYMGYETGLSAFGDIFAWFKRLTGRELPALAEEASKLELRDDLPLATDFFNGRRAPNPSNIVTASISGLRITSGPAEIYRALVEAAAFGSKACIDQYIDGGIRIDKMIAVGGIAQKSPFVMQMLCDVLGAPIEVSDCKDACAMGAAIHAAVAAGLYPSVLAAEDALCPGACATYTPDKQRHEFYLKRYERYKELAQFVL
ncbi:MAG: ribulokinase, partial [Bacteroidales bacterium]|nr:ribulokinase [Bacteroidales bacterium]